MVLKLIPKLRFAAARLRGRGALDADDLVQVGLMGAVKAYKRFDAARGRVIPFILQRARFAMVDEIRRMDHISRMYRRKGHIDGRILPMMMSLQTSDPTLVPRDLVDKNNVLPFEQASRSDIWDAVRKLVKPKEARILELHYRGMTHEAVAIAVGYTESYVCTLVKRGLNKIKRKWKPA